MGNTLKSFLTRIFTPHSDTVEISTGTSQPGRTKQNDVGSLSTEDDEPDGPMQSMKIFTMAEVRSTMGNFKPSSMIGEGGFGKVYKGWVNEETLAPARPGSGIPVAVKLYSGSSSLDIKQWQAEVRVLGRLSHPNLVKLLGYCWEDDRFVLVYELMGGGSLDQHLFAPKKEVLSWGTRLKIALGAARGLAFLHSSEKSVIYRDFKPSNILLDSDYNAKVSDFGLARYGPRKGESYVTTSVMGTPGYAAPEYVATGRLYIKSDVYGFGIVLLEILTGMKLTDSVRRAKEYNLVEWKKPYLDDGKKIMKKIMDPRLEEYSVRAAQRVAKLTLSCLDVSPKCRPSMDVVVTTLEQATLESQE